MQRRAQTAPLLPEEPAHLERSLRVGSEQVPSSGPRSAQRRSAWRTLDGARFARPRFGRGAIVSGLALALLAGPATAADDRGAIYEKNDRAGNGLSLRLQGGVSSAFGAGRELLSLGSHFGIEFGSQVRLDARQAATPEVVISQVEWPFADGAPLDTRLVGGSVRLSRVLVGGRHDLALGPVLVWSALRLGFCFARVGLSAVELARGAGERPDTELGFAVDFAAGAQLMVWSFIGVGPFLEVNGAFVSDPAGMGLGMGSFAFGVNVAFLLPVGDARSSVFPLKRIDGKQAGAAAP